MARGWEATVTTDAATTDEIAEAITHVNDMVKRLQHHPDNTAYVTGHRRLDALLTHWQSTREGQGVSP